MRRWITCRYVAALGCTESLHAEALLAYLDSRTASEERSRPMSDAFPTISTTPAKRPPSRREVLWNELEDLHARLQLAPPTQTYTIEELEEVVAKLRAQLEQPAL